MNGEGNLQQFLDSISGILQQPASVILARVLGAILLLLVGRLIAKTLMAIIRRFIDHYKVDETVAQYLGMVFYYLFLIVVVVTALALLGIPTTSIIAILGAATLAIGLALQDSIGNIASGVLIVILRPYTLGDFVKINDIEGSVRHIRLYHTHLTTPDNKSVYIPNKEVMSNEIINYSENNLLRLEIMIGIGYEDNILEAKNLLQEILSADERIVDEPAPVVAVKELAPSTVNLVARPFVHYTDAVAVEFTLLEEIKARFEQAEISMPYPRKEIFLLGDQSESA